MAVKHLDHLNLTVRDFDATVDWYRRAFGFTVVEEAVDERGVRWGVIRAGEALLCIYEHPDLVFEDCDGARSKGRHGMCHFGLRVDDRVAWEATVEREGLEILYGGAVHWPHSTAWYVQDPTGWEIEVVGWNDDRVRFGGSLTRHGGYAGRMTFPKPFFRWRPHPWHGLEVGPDAPRVVHAYVEITPFDTVKYELDKETGYLRVDRPQHTSSQPPSLYGLVPRTYCGDRVGALMEGADGGDGDPLDICVISERPIMRPEVILDARVVGGLPMLDGGEADDKIIAVLASDRFWASAQDLPDLPDVLVERLRHYFLTYKLEPEGAPPVSIGDAYGRDRAHAVIEASIADYADAFGA